MVLLVYAVTLLLAVLISRRAERTVLSTAVLFLVSGFLAGRGFLGRSPHLNPDVVARLSELALFSVLFTDGMRLSIRDLAHDWLLPARALFRGMPLTIAGIALAGRFIGQMSWSHAFLLGAALSSTDPVFVAAVFRVREVPDRVKHLLNVESGLNDGLALPVVLVLLSMVSPQGSSSWKIIEEMLLGIAIGIALPWIAIRLEALDVFGAAEHYQPLNAVAIGLIVLGVCWAMNANTFLAAFSAGMSVATFGPDARDSFHGFGELVTELLKLAALLVFAMLIAPRFFEPVSWRDIVFVLIAVFLVRLIVFEAAMVKTGLARRERLIAGWFGPKGFASVVYGYMILRASFSGADKLAHIMAIAIVVSIVVYSSTDILVARWLRRHPAGIADGRFKRPAA